MTSGALRLRTAPQALEGTCPPAHVIKPVAPGQDFSLEWVSRLRAGDERAFEAVVREYHRPLHTYILRATKASEVADDLVQDLFWRLWQNRDSLLPDANLRVYLYVAARNHLFDYYRKVRSARGVFDRSVIADEQTDQDTLNPFTAVTNAELEQAVAEAIRGLPERCREVWTLSRDDGLSYAEIADVTGVSINTVKTQMTRAMRVLRTAVAPFLSLVILINGISGP